MVNKTLRRSCILTLVAVLGLVFAGLNTSFAGAAASSVGSPNGFTISPVLTEITVNKGQTQTVPITVSNPTAQPITADPIVNDFIASADESGSPRLLLKQNAVLPVNNFKSLVGTIQPVTIGPNQSTTVNVNIHVPQDALSGGYYGAVRFVPAQESKGLNIGLTASVGSLFLITVPGNLTTSLTLSQFSASDANGNPSSYFTSGQVSTLIRLAASGNIYTQPFGTIILKDMWGHTVSTTQFNDINPKDSILPQSTRKFIVALPHHKYLGKYTITLSIGYGLNGAGNQLIVAKTSFWYIPVWLEFVVLAVVVLIVIVIYLIIHKIRNRKFRRL